MVPITSVDQAAEVLRLLSAPESPLKRLLEGIAQATSPGAASRADPSEEDGRGGGAPGLLDRVNALKDKLTGKLSAVDGALGPELVEPAFVPRVLKDLHELVITTGKNPAPIDAILKNLGDLFVQVDAVLSASEGGEWCPLT